MLISQQNSLAEAYCTLSHMLSTVWIGIYVNCVRLATVRHCRSLQLAMIQATSRLITATAFAYSNKSDWRRRTFGWL